MTRIISGISVAQGATIINAAITFLQFTITLSLVVILVRFMPRTNTAASWTSISRTLQSSLWPTILTTGSNKGPGVVASAASRLTVLTSILAAVAGVILPLGLSQGPLVPVDPRNLDAQYVRDNSALASATTPDRGGFAYGRICSLLEELLACPGNNNPNDTAFSPTLVETFNSTPHGPFSMQYRRFSRDIPNGGPSIPVIGGAESFVLRNDTFAVDGLIIDMSSNHPGVGIWNQSLPNVTNGATWSQDVLWLEPVTECVNTNLTLDYTLKDNPSILIPNFTLTDRGGFVNLVKVLPPFHHNGQDIDLAGQAYFGAAWSNAYSLKYLNGTRESSFIGATYPLTPEMLLLNPGKVDFLRLEYLNATAELDVLCQGYAGGDTANVTNIHVSCGIFLGPPLRADDGDPRRFDLGSRWTQDLYSCASATRASIQTVTFSTNTSSGLQAMNITRNLSGPDVLWAMERTNMIISEVDLLWGRVGDQYEGDPSLWTVRAAGLYLPAGGASWWHVFPTGVPPAAHAATWSLIYQISSLSQRFIPADYTGSTDFAILSKLQSLVSQDPNTGNAQIRNLVWTDIMANYIISVPMNQTLWGAEYVRSIEYDFRFAIPGFILILIWLPSFLGAIMVLITHSLTFDHMKDVLDHVSVGRVVVGASALRVRRVNNRFMGASPLDSKFPSSPTTFVVDLGDNWGVPSLRQNEGNLADMVGDTLVTLELSRSGGVSHPRERDKLMEYL
ncbi:hypothetical protein P691DRAFT_764374 [Macrolepiota fuliginosa MF-IS2]|uniref:Uncharacterized protein n=1 Tax=Macrolepiota fuliginosa MF-IS2 TaxID=1400762 RepID=A0A9P6BXQ1_9AGAR|nr:hypothetical protein P691DRAFT_764374 [Macrolepiota fuliginosa MF-IS2]